MRDYGDGTHNIEQWSSDEDDTQAAIPSPTTPYQRDITTLYQGFDDLEPKSFDEDYTRVNTLFKPPRALDPLHGRVFHAPGTRIHDTTKKKCWPRIRYHDHAAIVTIVLRV
ncbi:hypothetical protein TNCV_921571 [Trichonephila clavipes]|nr:hypothetical protein TNCV_921571 [Trichonephila clavipes]